MSPLSDIPVEIANHILGSLPTPDLLNLCLTKKSIRRLAEPFLYSEIALKWDYCPTPRIVPLLRTLLGRPELWYCIDSVIMDECSTVNGRSCGLDPKNIDISFEQCVDVIRKTRVPYTDEWIEKLSSDTTCLEALYALFIASLSKPKRLVMTVEFINGRKLIGQVVQSKALGVAALSRFEQLRDVTYDKGTDYNNHKNNWIFPDVMSLFYLPALENIKAWIPTPPVFEWPMEAPNLDQLTSLDIACLSEDGLARILVLTPNLKSLVWAWHCDETNYPGNAMVLNFESILESLMPVKDTLEKLYIRLWIGPFLIPEIDPELTVSGSLAGLAGFRRLTHLAVPFIALAGFGDTLLPIEDGVPPSVKTLVLSDDVLIKDEVRWQQVLEESSESDYELAEVIDGHIEAFCDNIPTKLPLLRDLIFLADRSFHLIFETVGFDATMAMYSQEDFNIRVSTRKQLAVDCSFD